MKKQITYLTVLVCILKFGLFVWATEYFGAEFMSTSVAEKKWGRTPLDKTIFRTGDNTKRESMAVDIVKNNIYVSKPMLLVRKELGDPDSYFFSDTIYAYKIMPYPGEKKEIWHLVFIPDDKLENVKEVKIHKKCCYKSPL